MSEQAVRLILNLCEFAPLISTVGSLGSFQGGDGSYLTFIQLRFKVNSVRALLMFCRWTGNTNRQPVPAAGRCSGWTVSLQQNDQSEIMKCLPHRFKELTGAFMPPWLQQL